MKRKFSQTIARFGWGPGLAAAMLFGGAPARGGEGEIDAPSQPLITVVSSSGWSVGAHYTVASRELKSDGELVELDADRVVAEVGYAVAPFLQLAAQAGWTKAELDRQKGNNGLGWAVIARANLAEHILRASPVIGRQEWVGAAVEMQYRYNESNQDQADLDWAETLVVPSVYYFRNRRGDALRKDYQATGLGLRGGLAFSSISGTYGGRDVEENRNFGFMLGGDVRWPSGWVARIRATVFGSNDQTIEIGTLFHF